MAIPTLTGSSFLGRQTHSIYFTCPHFQISDLQGLVLIVELTQLT